MAEYEREFAYFSKYAREVVSTEEEMCTCFEDGLNDEIKMMIGGTEIQQFVRQRERKARDFNKRNFPSRFSTPPQKKAREEDNHVVVSLEF
ncbi:Hexaprenyldihydroxybenzoate methyltransferase, mitochondrial-like protein [Gossypium australe]|uniref:Hexaprenyldihydroxybenzoate methyltransferase, mitochondrial-like protein n=1 Tax=Gossypium australe TaxID=47621 RepID=A0A5B6TAJ6_9ROSI|nr:Hexaprenyldihydroxybenzoate methyltransferase, mitochondrial-like protein [Gossypium australe]